MGGSGLYSLAQVCLLEQGPSRPELVGGLVGVTLSISFLLGPLLGGAIAEWNWRGIFWFKWVASQPFFSLMGLNTDVLVAYPLARWPCWGSTPSGPRNGATDMAPRRRSPRSTFLATCCSLRRRFSPSLLCKRPGPLFGAGPAPLSSGPWSQRVLVGCSWAYGSTACVTDPAGGSSPSSRCVSSGTESTCYVSCNVLPLSLV